MHQPHSEVSTAEDLNGLILDGTKIQWHTDRLEAWERGERIAPITVDMSLTRACQMSCKFCYAMLQANDEYVITEDVMRSFLDDSAEMGVRGISLVSDGESTMSPVYVFTIQHGASLGISMATGTNGYAFTEDSLSAVLPHHTYMRFNVSGGTPERYCDIMGVKPAVFERVMKNIRYAVEYKAQNGLDVTLGIQMVLMPDMGDQIIPFAELGRDLGVDYAVIKHCSDDEDGSLGVDYDKYESLYPLLKEAESLSSDSYQVKVKWEKIGSKGIRDYSRCYGPPFIIQLSGTGLVAPCGQFFNSRYAKFQIGNIVEQRWVDIWKSERYWEVMHYLASDEFDARRQCGSLCLAHLSNDALDKHVKSVAPIVSPVGPMPLHKNFI